MVLNVLYMSYILFTIFFERWLSFGAPPSSFSRGPSSYSSDWSDSRDYGYSRRQIKIEEDVNENYKSGVAAGVERHISHSEQLEMRYGLNTFGRCTKPTKEQIGDLWKYVRMLLDLYTYLSSRTFLDHHNVEVVRDIVQEIFK